MDDLSKIRKSIDEIDQQIHQLICQRAEKAIQVRQIKQQQEQQTHFYRPEREAQVLRAIQQKPCSPLDKQDMVRIFRTIMSACLAVQEPIKIAFLGPLGTFSQQATMEHFGPSADLIPQISIEKVFSEVHAQHANYGVVPIENSTTGVIDLTIHAFAQNNVKICGEISIPIHHHLLVNLENKTPIHTIVSHQQSLQQCQHWLTQHYPQIETVAVSSNAAAAKQAQQQPGVAAIAGTIAAEQYDLTIEARNIEDNPDNFTRFLVIGEQTTIPSGNDRSSLLITAKNLPGMLERVINPFGKNHVNMTLIKSHPAPQQKDSYLFYLECDGHYHDSALQKALLQLQNESISVKMLGSYPKAVL